MMRSGLWNVCLLACAGPSLGGEFDQLQQLMSCYDDPAPTQVLESLSAAGAMVRRSGPGDDGDYCWDLQPELLWNHVAFTALCVVSDDAEGIASHPQFYWSAAEAPWTEIWLLADSSKATLKQWAATTLGPRSHFEIDPAGSEVDVVALSCSEWWFPLQD